MDVNRKEIDMLNSVACLVRCVYHCILISEPNLYYHVSEIKKTKIFKQK